MVRFDVGFVVAAIAYAILGIALGIWMGINQDFAPRHIHAHINLLGWTSMGLYGLVHRAWPELRFHPLARWQFWTAMLGTPVFLIGLPLAMFHGQPIGAIVGSLLILLAALDVRVHLLAQSRGEWRGVKPFGSSAADSAAVAVII